MVKRRVTNPSYFRRRKSPPEEHVQSAMEYLMTYSWSILVIAIVLGALFALGIFGGTSYTVTACIASTGYLCQSPLLNSTGNLSMTFGEEGYPITITGTACTQKTTLPSSFISEPPITLQPGQEKSIIFQCPITGRSVGTPFTGHLWILYNQGSQSGLYADVAKISAEVSITGALPSGSSSSGSGGGNGAYMYVVNAGSDTVNIINTATYAQMGSIAQGLPAPYFAAFSPSGTFAYVTNYYLPYDVAIVNTATSTVVGAITQGISSPEGVAFSPDGTYAYVVDSSNSTIAIINTATNTVEGIINPSLFSPMDVAISPTGTYAYVTDYEPSGIGIAIISTATKAVVGTISAGLSNADGVAFSPSGTYAYVTNHMSENVSIVDTATNTVTGYITGGFDWPIGVAFSHDGAYAYVANGGPGSGNIAIINTATESVVGSITQYISDPQDVALPP